MEPKGHTLDDLTWLPAPKILALGKNEIHIWRMWLDQDTSAVENLRSMLSKDEQQRAARFKLERDRTRFIVVRGTLRKLLERYTGLSLNKHSFHYGRYGKPALPANSIIYFNLAHSQDLVLYAFARERELGIDVECVRPEFADEEIAARYLSPRELSLLRALPSERRAERFFSYWTCKEAYLKAKGMGLQVQLNSFSVTLPDTVGTLPRDVETGWKVITFAAWSDCPAAIAYQGAGCKISFFSWVCQVA